MRRERKKSLMANKIRVCNSAKFKARRVVFGASASRGEYVLETRSLGAVMSLWVGLAGICVHILAGELARRKEFATS